MARKNLISDFIRMRVGRPPSDRKDLPIVDKNQEIVEKVEADSTELYSLSQLNQLRTIAQDRDTQYKLYDEMSTDSVIAAALEIYADDATAFDERGRIIWVESDDKEIADAGNRLLDILEIPERAWKHIYMACKYGDYYLKLYRINDNGDTTDESKNTSQINVKVVNDKTEYKGTIYSPNYEEYVEDVSDPSTVFDLRKRGKTAGFVQVNKEKVSQTYQTLNKTYMLKDVDLYRPDRMIHIIIGEDLSREQETMTLEFEDGTSETYTVAKGKSILYDVYPIQKELQLLEDSLILNRLTRSSLIRLLEIEVGDMPKKEVNNYLRRVKNLIEQHISLDKDSGSYQSYNAPGPIDNVIYIPTKNGRGHITINNLGGDVNVRDIADIDYFNNKRSGALKIPRGFLGDDMEGCLRGDTKLLLLNGQHRTIKYLYENRDEYIGKGIMSCNEDGTLVPTVILDIKQTRKDATFVRVHLDNGEFFDVTEDHLCMKRDGTFEWADDLKPGDSLMPLYNRVDQGRRYVWDNKEEVWKPQESLYENVIQELDDLKKDTLYDHKVIKVERLDVVEDAYDIEVENESHTFILEAGVFVHNSGLSNGGSLTKLSARYARTIKRIQTSYIRAITELLNLFFVDKKLDYVNKFTVRMASPSTQEDMDRTEVLGNNVDLVSSIMDLMGSFEGETQKNILIDLVSDILKMPDIAEHLKSDSTPEEDIDIEGSPSGSSTPSGFSDFSDVSSDFGMESSSEDTGGFTDQEYSEFEDTL